MIEEIKLKIPMCTRMNDLDIKIRLSDWVINFNETCRVTEISLNLGSHEKKSIDKFINWFEDNLYDVVYFGIKDKKKDYRFKLAQRNVLSFTPPVKIDNILRGSTINSVSFFDISFIFNLDFNELIRLINILKDKTHKDLDYFFVANKKGGK